ncbi:MAG TPA: hypothetical protein VKN99_10685 [Polyangia bacterium]|nr:hypothetical protein [Polyangia bacterium]
MDKHGKRSQLASIDNSVLARVSGGDFYDELVNSWSWTFANSSCTDAVQGAARAAWQSSGWEAANGAAQSAWNGPDCAYYGWFDNSSWFS